MKKIISFILALTMIFALCACGSDAPSSSSDQQKTTTEKTDEDDASAVDVDNGDLIREEEMLAGLWLCLDHINYDKIVDFMYLTDDGYILRHSFDLSSDEFYDLDCYINVIGDSTSSECLEQYFSGEEDIRAIDEIFTDGYYAVNKYDIRDNEIIISYPDGEKETILFAYNPLNSMCDMSITESGEEYYYEKYNCYLDDNFSYFVGNWTYEQIEWSESKYVDNTKEFYDSGSLFFGENFRVNESGGNTGGWGYNDGILEIDGARYDVIKLTNNVFVIYHEREYDTCTYYDFSVFSRA